MQQRRLRLGDVIDDYCPRERRITNHAVVAMIEDTVKQTRCSTCDAEHEYKQAKVPATRRRKTGAPVAQLVEGAVPLPETADLPEEVAELEDVPAITENADSIEEPAALAAAAEPAETTVESDIETEAEAETTADESDNWPVHRPLIRATLPRPEGQVPERKAPDFTMRQGGKFDPNRNGRHRGGGHRQGRQAQGPSQFGQGSSRFGGQRGPGQGQGGGPHGQRHGGGNRPPGQGGGGNRAGQGQGPGRGQRPGGGRKRGR